MISLARARLRKSQVRNSRLESGRRGKGNGWRKWGKDQRPPCSSRQRRRRLRLLRRRLLGRRLSKAICLVDVRGNDLGTPVWESVRAGTALRCASRPPRSRKKLGRPALTVTTRRLPTVKKRIRLVLYLLFYVWSSINRTLYCSNNLSSHACLAERTNQ